MSLCFIRFHIVQYRFHNMMFSQLQSKSVRRSLTRHRNFVYMCLVSESSVLVDNQILCDICEILIKNFCYLALVLDNSFLLNIKNFLTPMPNAGRCPSAGSYVDPNPP